MVLKIIVFIVLCLLLTPQRLVCAQSGIFINEFLAHPSTGNKEWVEFYNPNNVDISNYYLDDDTDFTSDSGSSSKKTLSALNVSDTIYPYLEFDSFLNNSGDYVVLFAPDGTIIDQYNYTKDPEIDVTIGRLPDGGDKYGTLAQTTKGAANGQPKEDPIPTPDPTPAQTVNTPQPTLQTTSLTSSKTPSPTKLISKSPSPQSKLSPAVLGQGTQSASPSADPISPNPSLIPPQNLADKKPQNTKVVYSMAGLGTILIASSFIFYFVTHRKTKHTENENDQDSYNQ